jgi:hypothetical protein
MKKKLIMGVLVLCSMILVVGSVFAIQTYNVKYSESYSDIDYKKENNQEESDDYIQSLVFAPMVITKTICKNHEIISN